MALRAFEARPDFIMIPGDIVYEVGRIADYREKFWPVYNADEPSPSAGAPLLRSTLFAAAPEPRRLQIYPRAAHNTVPLQPDWGVVVADWARGVLGAVDGTSAR